MRFPSPLTALALVLSALACTPSEPALAQASPAQDDPAKNYTLQPDVIYARKFGTALTLDILRPKAKANGLGVILVNSGGWYSEHRADGGYGQCSSFLDRGYTVFTVTHGCQPKFSIPEIFEDVKRGIRFVRAHAKEYGVDPDHLGITGSSAGGHLSCLVGTAADPGNPTAEDPIDRFSSRVQAVACFFPPTDFLNYGKPGEDAIGRGILWQYSGAFSFQDYDPYWRKLNPVTDEAKIRQLGASISPVTHVSENDAPTLIIHGDKDWLVPIQQSEELIEKLKAAGVDARLITHPGGGHGWPDIHPDYEKLADWFDSHLKK